MGLEYPQYLRMLRDKYNAKLSGVGDYYLKVSFLTKEDAETFAKILDKRLKQIFINLE
jgi:hypothetical protein